MTDLLLFEMGRVFAPDLPPGHPEPGNLALLVTGSANPRSWRHGGGVRALDIHDLRGVLERLLAPAELEFRPVDPAPGSPVALSAEIFVDGREIGGLAQMSPEWTKDLELRGEVFVADLKLRALANIENTAGTFKPLPAFSERHARPRRGRGPRAATRPDRRPSCTGRRNRSFPRCSSSMCSPTTGVKRSPPTKSRWLIR